MGGRWLDCFFGVGEGVRTGAFYSAGRWSSIFFSLGWRAFIAWKTLNSFFDVVSWEFGRELGKELAQRGVGRERCFGFVGFKYVLLFCVLSF